MEKSIVEKLVNGQGNHFFVDSCNKVITVSIFSIVAIKIDLPNEEVSIEEATEQLLNIGDDFKKEVMESQNELLLMARIYMRAYNQGQGKNDVV